MSRPHPTDSTSSHLHEVKPHATELLPFVPNCKNRLQIKGGVPWWLIALSSERLLQDLRLRARPNHVLHEK